MLQCILLFSNYFLEHWPGKLLKTRFDILQVLHWPSSILSCVAAKWLINACCVGSWEASCERMGSWHGLAILGAQTSAKQPQMLQTYPVGVPYESRVLEIRELELHLEPEEVDETKNWNQLESARIALPGNLMRTKFVRCTKRFEIERLEFLQLITRSKSSSGTCAQQEGEGLVVAICILTPFSTSPSCSLFSWSFQRWRFVETWWITKSPQTATAEAVQQ